MEQALDHFLQIHLTDTPESFLQALEKEQIQEIGGYWLFTGQAGEKQFEKNLNYLASSETISPTDYQNWQKETDFHFIAQTIDGDYLVASKEQIRFIPVSLYREDLETYSLTLGEFFQAYFNGKLVSKIIPKITNKKQ